MGFGTQGSTPLLQQEVGFYWLRFPFGHFGTPWGGWASELVAGVEINTFEFGVQVIRTVSWAWFSFSHARFSGHLQV